MEKLKMESVNLVHNNIDKIGVLFPNVITEMRDEKGKLKKGINFGLLKQELSSDVIDGEEVYGFTWSGKRKAILDANTPTRKTLRPCIEESKDWENTGNLYIEGDNLDILKLLQESYSNSIKLIYIDPPYNTGKDFIYKDNYRINKNDYKEQLGVFKKKESSLFHNIETDGRYHCEWCSMLYPRIRLAHNLLKEDGVIFISIDDNEVTNLTKICDEIFGEVNRIAIICHKARASISNDKIISPNHNFILFYAKDINLIFEHRKLIGLDPDLTGFELDDNDGRGKYRLVPVDGPGGARKGNPFYEFMGVEGYFRFSKETMENKFKEGLVVKKRNSLYQKYFIVTAKNKRKTDTTWWEDGGLTSSATSKLKELMGGLFFDNPKPLELILRMLKLITYSDKKSIILDFFSGSATTAHAVMKLNSEDGGSRKYIMMQLPEILNMSDAYKAGYKTICEIGKERIRLSGERIKIENKDKENINSLDIGFRVLKVDSTNMKDAYYMAKEYNNPLVEGLESNIKEDRTDMDLLFSVLLDLGLPLSLCHRIEKIEGITVHIVDKGSLVACFEEKISENVLRDIAKFKPLRVVFKKSSFTKSPDKIEVIELLKLLTPKTTVRVI